ncbi:hypothetical protein [Tenacibaculum finnmarkense]|uniref:hypothetical protein n=1 Tax=Tenacibaculum finnmarkense TaxID=2781243 RepID=UPI001E639056|nr:hypothetical protein [Tenacibaculum finnmarkense]MCD8413709.1 hypothetical protein [Tenacibaculum finnmarkense genomovar ulcerans]MCG8208383.1 hypothetical protein [Tenacibaculum finnmarkense genomovar finnmarkense]MCG8724389.1 hypothetical protein [Tenacibaculum finnmarkense]MCG8742706.1 hypothetical protein [Tenacibaculum finnmarkense]MCG8766112.1 hypothetical protein [Tenacibaculum finnmarkense]
MEEINEIHFLKLLSSKTVSEHTDFLINFKNVTSINLNQVTLSNKFINCKFKGKKVTFTNPSLDELELTHIFSFNDCEFENDISFTDCFIQEITFLNISKPIKKLHLGAKKIGYFTFECTENLNQEILNNINITIYNCEIVNYLEFLHLKSSGNLDILRCNINQLKIHDSKFKRIDINYNKFLKDFQFSKNIVEDSYIKYNKFEKTNFSFTDFGSNANFKFNDFKSTALFEKLKNKKWGTIKFISCNFFKYVHFNKSELYKLHIDTSKFQEFASFQDLELNSIFLDRTIFEKPAFFDDIQIHKFDDCDKRTLRNVKQQLLRADNKIDYDEFRAQELNSYKEELKNKIKLKSTINRKKLKRDLIILKVNSFFSNNGTDWVKAIKNTLFVAFLFYSIFFVIFNYKREFDLGGYNEYFMGLFRYFLLTDIHNPLTEKSEYLDNIITWIPFIFGKILIGIGVYHILVSFRKFKR